MYTKIQSGKLNHERTKLTELNAIINIHLEIAADHTRYDLPQVLNPL